MPRSVIIPVTNVYAKGGYTVKIKIGKNIKDMHINSNLPTRK